ncbi:hypothetical protein [Sporosarcina sp. FSL K6-3508]|uniref:hypothetical protein n=1 Tax=Sporosarcina sp. FSL K6-3508 TaxID=2921557 RepID=UPI00315A781A
MFPTPHTVTVYKPGEDDFWSNAGDAVVLIIKCRVDEKTQVVKNRMGDEVVVGAEIMFRGLPDIDYDDKIEFINERGNSLKREPELIAPARKLNGKALYTSVYL